MSAGSFIVSGYARLPAADSFLASNRQSRLPTASRFSSVGIKLNFCTKLLTEAQIAEAQQQAGDTEAARRTLVQARVYAEGFGEGDSRSGFFRSYYLSEIAKAQVQVGDVAEATDTAQLITHQEERGWALRAIAEGTAHENTGPV